jgi:hypothetical protein
MGASPTLIPTTPDFPERKKDPDILAAQAALKAFPIPQHIVDSRRPLYEYDKSIETALHKMFSREAFLKNMESPLKPFHLVGVDEHIRGLIHTVRSEATSDTEVQAYRSSLKATYRVERSNFLATDEGKRFCQLVADLDRAETSFIRRNKYANIYGKESPEQFAKRLDSKVKNLLNEEVTGRLAEEDKLRVGDGSGSSPYTKTR